MVAALAKHLNHIDLIGLNWRRLGRYRLSSRFMLNRQVIHRQWNANYIAEECHLIEPVRRARAIFEVE